MVSKKVLLLGASGSIGTQTLDILDKHPGCFELVGFSVGKRSNVIEPILKKYKSVTKVYLLDKDESKRLVSLYPNIKFYTEDISDIVKQCDFDICVDALVGFVGMEPAIETLKKDKILCLANKEALVTGGTVVNELLAQGHGKLYPIDSEHVALAKCLSRVKPEEVERLIITASGGALRNMPLDQLKNATADDALKHPNWSMGKKITIDCATMMNKGFEIIEAYYLFGYPLEKVSVIMHDESLVHSMVQLKDGSYILDYGKPDMHNMIEYALLESNIDFDLVRVKNLSELKDCHFHEYNPDRYPLCELAKKCLKDGATKMIALNAANEIAVNLFLENKIGFLDISKMVEKAVNAEKLCKTPSIEMIKAIDKRVRREVR